MRALGYPWKSYELARLVCKNLCEMHDGAWGCYVVATCQTLFLGLWRGVECLCCGDLDILTYWCVISIFTMLQCALGRQRVPWFRSCYRRDRGIFGRGAGLKWATKCVHSGDSDVISFTGRVSNCRIVWNLVEVFFKSCTYRSFRDTGKLSWSGCFGSIPRACVYRNEARRPAGEEIVR